MSAMLVSTAFAAESEVSVSNGSETLVHRFTSENELEYAMNAGELFEGFGELDNGSEKLTVSYSGLDSYKTELYIRLDALALPGEGKLTPLNYYTFTVKDSSGNILLSHVADAENDARSKELPLATLAGTGSVEFDISYNGDASKKESVDLSKLGISVLLRRADKLEVAPTAAPTVKPTEKPAVETARPTLRPKFDFDDLSEKAQGIIFNTDDDTKPDGTQASGKQTVKVCGTDIPPGRYVVSGSGNLKITRANGTVKGDVKVNNTKGTVLLEKGDVLTITPLDGEEKAKLRFDAATSTTGEVGKVSPQNKTNPKTGEGDNAPFIAIAVGLLALAAFAGLEILKRKKTN